MSIKESQEQKRKGDGERTETNITGKRIKLEGAQEKISIVENTVKTRDRNANSEHKEEKIKGLGRK